MKLGHKLLTEKVNHKSIINMHDIKKYSRKRKQRYGHGVRDPGSYCSRAGSAQKQDEPVPVRQVRRRILRCCH